MEVIAHRGNNREFYQNTLKSFEASVTCGADRIELDVHATRDGRLAIYHDFLWKGVPLTEMTAAEVARVNLPGGEQIPFLEDVLLHFLPRIEINVEVKGPSERAGELLADLLHRSALQDRVVVSSFYPEALHVLRRRCPSVRRACLIGDDALFWPHFSHQSALVFMAETASSILHPRVDLVDELLMEQAKVRAWKVYPWVPMAGEQRDREDLWFSLQSVGVDGLCTNYPRELKAWLRLQASASYSERHYHETLQQLAVDVSLEPRP